MLAWLARYERVLILFLLIGLLLFVRRALAAWQDLQEAVFQLEQDYARERLRQSLLAALLSLLALAALVLTVHGWGGATLSLAGQAAGEATGTPAASGTPVNAVQTPTPTPLPTVAVKDREGCVPDRVMITDPAPGSTVSGEIQIKGTAWLENFGFYKVEFAPVGQSLFLTIEADRVPRVNDVLVQSWDTTDLPPGDYVLQLVVVDNTGQALPPCRVRFTIAPAQK
ncbi:MAG: hypothetical protein GXO54_02605 [Chloroflexi bacterium]|nr:hypothetical protein [Chloroflexota bacterium]